MSSKKSTKHKGRKSGAKFTQWAAWIFLAVVVIGLVYLVYDSTRPEEPAAASRDPLPVEVSVDTAYLMYTNGAYLLDVRTVNEFSAASIPNSVNIPLDELAGRLDEIPQEVDIIVVDDRGDLSPQGRDILLEAGFPRVTAMLGGLEVWILDRLYIFQGTYPR